MYTSNLNVVAHTATGSSFDAAVVGSVLLLDKTLYNAKIAILGRLCPSAAYAYKQKKHTVCNIMHMYFSHLY